MKQLLAGAFCLLAAGSVQAATLTFLMEGTNPGGRSNYRGTVALTEISEGANGEKSGLVTWRVNRSAPVKGIALTTTDSPARISISFPNRPIPGVALGTIMADGSVRLQWYTGGTTAGTEVWTPTR